MAKAKNRNSTKTDQSAAFDRLCEMEYDVNAVSNFSHALARLAETLEDQEAGVVQQIAWEIRDRAKNIEAGRQALAMVVARPKKRFNRETYKVLR